MKVQWLLAKLTPTFTNNRCPAEVEHPPDSEHNVSITTKEYIQSPSVEKLLIVYFWIEKAGA